MALTDDQRAMLRLLAQREEGYEDIAALMGISVEEVRARVKEALAGLDQAAAPPPARAEPPRPSTPQPAREPEPEPAAEPQHERPAPASATPPPRKTFSRSLPSLPKIHMPRERRRLVELLGGALVTLLIVLFVTGAVDLGGGDDDSDPATAGGGNGGTQLTAAEEEKLTQARLQPVDGGDAEGRAIFGRVGQEEVVLQVTADGLEPTPKDQSYTVWLYRSPKLALRVGSVKVGDEGRLGARFPVPAELLGYVASGAFPQIRVSQTSDAAYRREVAQAEKQERLPRYSGETLLRGKITGPIVKGQQSAGGG